jgi:hypothetical protein
MHSTAIPYCAFCMLSGIAMLIGILVVCFTAPQPGMFVLFYILHTQHGQNPKKDWFFLQVL